MCLDRAPPRWGSIPTECAWRAPLGRVPVARCAVRGTRCIMVARPVQTPGPSGRSFSEPTRLRARHALGPRVGSLSGHSVAPRRANPGEQLASTVSPVLGGRLSVLLLPVAFPGRDPTRALELRRPVELLRRVGPGRGPTVSESPRASRVLRDSRRVNREGRVVSASVTARSAKRWEC